MSSIYNVLILDDEPTAREILQMHLSKLEQFCVVASCKNAAEAFTVLSKEQVHLIFLDINMPEVSGLMFAKAIGAQTKIIFTTAHREYAVEGFELQAVDYLLKPISLDRCMQAAQRFQELQETSTPKEQKDPFTFFRIDRRMVKVDFKNLLYAESRGDYLKLHTISGVLITRETIANVLDKLPEGMFLRTHRSFFVQLSKIDSYTNEHIEIGKNSIPISRSYRDTVLSRLSLH